MDRSVFYKIGRPEAIGTRGDLCKLATCLLLNTSFCVDARNIIHGSLAQERCIYLALKCFITRSLRLRKAGKHSGSYSILSQMPSCGNSHAVLWRTVQTLLRTSSKQHNFAHNMAEVLQCILPPGCIIKWYGMVWGGCGSDVERVVH